MVNFIASSLKDYLNVFFFVGNILNVVIYRLTIVLFNIMAKTPVKMFTIITKCKKLYLI